MERPGITMVWSMILLLSRTTSSMRPSERRTTTAAPGWHSRIGQAGVQRFAEDCLYWEWVSDGRRRNSRRRIRRCDDPHFGRRIQYPLASRGGGIRGHPPHAPPPPHPPPPPPPPP